VFKLLHRSLGALVYRQLRSLGLDREAAGDLATDAIVEYVTRPERFNPLRSSLFTYLGMIARRDGLNLLRGRAAAAKNFDKLVELAVAEGNNTGEQNHAPLEAARIMQRHGQDLVTSREEQEVLNLYLAGEKETATYAAALGAAHLGVEEQKVLVKQYRDRLEKRLTRLGRELAK
jgi:DNA-directed RNA polymerase specialized sigma24 family protein